MSNQNEIDSMDVDSNQTEAVKQNEASSSTRNGKKAMDPKKKAALQEKLKKLVAEYRKIILSGCGNWRCTNPKCKSNMINKEKIISQADASKQALKMIKSKSKKCDSFPKLKITPFTYETIQQIEKEEKEQEEKKSINKSNKIHKIIIDAFTHWDILYDSFKTNTKATNKDVAINFDELDKTFNIIMAQDELCKDIQNVLSERMDFYLDDIKTNSASLDMELLRALIILISCPIILSEDIDCHYLLNKLLLIFECINNVDFKCIKIIHEWVSNIHVDRLHNILHSLHQFMTLTITMKEDEIEDLTDDWKVELKYDDTEDNDERDEINQEIEKKQQTQREKYIKNKIAPTIKFIDILFIANKIKRNCVCQQQEIQEQKEEKEQENKMDIDKLDNNNNNESNENKIIIINNEKYKTLNLTLFHNDGLNEAICSKTISRSHIHRRDFIHYKEHDFFTFLSYPYLLTAASKSRYLEFENLLRQHRARRRRMFDLMLSGGVNILGGGGLNRNQLIEELDLVLRIRRTSVIQDTLGILQLQEAHHLRKRLRIIFDGEQGIDQGGLTKEYFQLIMKELFDPNYGMFIFNKQTANYWFNRDSFDLYASDTKQCLINYELVGKLVGIAIYNNTILDLRFPRVIFKKILETEAIIFTDFIDYDPEMAKGFQQLLSYAGDDIEDIYCRNFLVQYKNIFGQEKTYDLLGSEGEKMMLNKANKKKYVDLYIKYILIHSIEQQFAAFLKGFKIVCDSELFNKYSSEELELLICGSKAFDFDALESSTKYEDGLHKNSRIVRDFWTIAHQLSDENKRKLLTFCTGSDRVPINGLGELTLTISKNGNDNTKLPTSHTCFNHLLLPEYSNREILKTRLLTAIQNSAGFGLL